MLKNKKYGELIESFDIRKENLLIYLKSVKPNLDYNIVRLTDPMGPALSDPSMEALVVSEETVKGGDEINKARKQINFSPLEIVKIDCVANTDPNSSDPKLSSTTLREKEWLLRHQNNQPK